MANPVESPVMIIGNGGREQALAWKLAHEGMEVFVAPGNGGTETVPNCQQVYLNPLDAAEVLQAAQDHHTGLVVIGPEKPLVAGIAEALRRNNILTYGPDRPGANLEGSKVDALYFMENHGIPHPESSVQTHYDRASWMVDTYWFHQKNGVVIKADGLCDGKGVFVCKTPDEAHDALRKLMVEKQFGEAGRRVILQELLEGYEVSVMAIVADGQYTLLPFSKDHKQVFDGNHGPNTGGMGAIAPHPWVRGELLKRIECEIVKRTAHGLHRDGIAYRGTLFPGVMVTADGPMVLEYNARFGDPETESVLPLLDGDLYPVLHGTSEGLLPFTIPFPTKVGACVAVTLASGGYPGPYETGKEIHGLDTAANRDDVIVFHAGTTQGNDGTVQTAGGRVLMVAGLGASIEEAVETAYGPIGENGIHFDGMHYRKDIGTNMPEQKYI